MEQLKYKIIGCLAGVIMLAGCGGTNITDPSNLDGDAASVGVSFEATQGSSMQALALALETGDDVSPITIIEAWTNVKEIDIKLPEGVRCEDIDFPLPVNAKCETELDDDEDEIKVEGPFVVDLINGVSTPPIETEIPSGLVNRVDVDIDDTENDADFSASGAPDSLLGNSLVIEGTVDLDGTPTPLSVRLNFNEDVRFENPAGLIVSEAVNLNQVLISFDVNDWFVGVDIGACVADGDVTVVEGKIIIDEDSTSGDCSDIENTIKQNIKDSGTLDEDDDDDTEDS